MGGLGDRMKEYERSFNYKLPERLPLIIRLDGKGFHTLTRTAAKPFDTRVNHFMNIAAISLCREIQGIRFVYIQSDEISLFVYPWSKQTSQAWFDNELQKIVSVSAGVASANATLAAIDSGYWSDSYPQSIVFDSRAFVLPMHEVVNYFIWRQQDWERNSLNMFCEAYFSSKSLLNKTAAQRHDMLHERGLNWNNLPIDLRRGRSIFYNSTTMGWDLSLNMPVISKDRNWFWKVTGIHVDRTIIEDQYS